MMYNLIPTRCIMIIKHWLSWIIFFFSFSLSDSLASHYELTISSSLFNHSLEGSLVNLSLLSIRAFLFFRMKREKDDVRKMRGMFFLASHSFLPSLIEERRVFFFPPDWIKNKTWSSSFSSWIMIEGIDPTLKWNSRLTTIIIITIIRSLYHEGISCLNIQQSGRLTTDYICLPNFFLTARTTKNFENRQEKEEGVRVFYLLSVWTCCVSDMTSRHAPAIRPLRG